MFLLNGTAIKGSQSIEEDNSTQVAQQRTLGGSVNRDFFGSNKRIWSMDYTNVNPTAFTVINTIYQNYLTTGTTVTWQVTEANYTIASTLVHVDLLIRKFNVRGSSYISDFTLILTEA
jgi:hypothetical protein